MARDWLPAIVDFQFLGGNEHFQAIARMQFLHQDRHVILDCLFAYSQTNRYFAVGSPRNSRRTICSSRMLSLIGPAATFRIDAVLNASITLYAKPGVI